MKDDSSQILDQAIIYSEAKRYREALYCGIAFTAATLLMMFIGGGSIWTLWFSLAFAIPALFCGIRAWRHRTPSLHPIAHVFRSRPDSIVRIFASNTKWKTQAGMKVSEEEHFVFLDDRGEKYSLRANKSSSAAVLRQLGAAFPRARIGYEPEN